MIPTVVKNLSVLRTRTFLGNPQYNHPESWKKTQDLQEYIYRSGKSAKFIYVNKRFFEQEIEKIDKNLVYAHTKAFGSESFQTFLKKRVLYIYDDSVQQCECRSFYHFGYCKHYLATKVYLGEIEVISFSS